MPAIITIDGLTAKITKVNFHPLINAIINPVKNPAVPAKIAPTLSPIPSSNLLISLKDREEFVLY